MTNPNGRSDPWANITKRLAAQARGAVRSGRGNFAVLHVTIVVDDCGHPVGWTAPVGERLEPRGAWLLDTNLVDKIDNGGVT